MNWLNQKVPAYLYEKSNIIRLIIFTALFALVFINIYKPFNSENWYNVSAFMFFVFSSLVILTGVLVVVIIRIIIYFHSKKHKITYLKYGIAILSEVFFMAVFYTLYRLFLKHWEGDIMAIFQESLINTALVLLLPYAIMILYFSWKDKENKLRLLGDEIIIPEKNPIIFFYDERDEMMLSMKQDTLLYLEAADNYVKIWYLQKGEVTHFLLRNTLKAMEEKFKNSHIIRCHRSYMVNMDQVKVIRREKAGVYLDLGLDKVPDVPISKTYFEKTTSWFMAYANNDKI